ncbi:4'-phosphopantetheinyl transferase family protein, partial [Streptomyces sp. ERV7]|uniref:4'-phosphopantetheinyl transferase family protein n=1 Tax=Streptomyces sp. ERV7 TaxID=1322334 RepID=UPI003B6375DC
MLAGLLPAGVAVAELFADPPSVELFPQEAALVAKAVDKRKREFATVRLCARTALAQLGHPPGPILPLGEGPAWAQRAPRWPDGVVGSMTHCDGYRAAAVAPTSAIASVGVDAEPNAPLPDGVRTMVTRPEEGLTLDRLAVSHPAVAWDRLLFSAKESVFKAWFPLTGRWLDFGDCVITPDPERGTFTGALRVPGPVVDGVRHDVFSGRWRTVEGEDGELVATVVV